MNFIQCYPSVFLKRAISEVRTKIFIKIMNAKELLKPRFEVINDYPNNNYKLNQVIETEENWLEGHSSSYFEEYPHLFKKLNWWESRKLEDMPKKLKSLCNDDFDIEKEEVFNILEWNMKTLDGIINHEKRQVCSLTSWNPEYGYIPVD
jgi:hypothetical protein